MGNYEIYGFCGSIARIPQVVKPGLYMKKVWPLEPKNVFGFTCNPPKTLYRIKLSNFIFKEEACWATPFGILMPSQLQI